MFIASAIKTNGQPTLSLSGKFTGTQTEVEDICAALRPNGLLYFEKEIHVKCSGDFVATGSMRRKIVEIIIDKFDSDKIEWCPELKKVRMSPKEATRLSSQPALA